MNNDIFSMFSPLLPKNSIAQEALANDKRLENMAMYYVTKGYTEVPSSINQEDVITYQKNISNTFKNFKNRISKGSFTIDQLEDRIYAQFGVVSEEFKKKAGVISEFDEEII